MIGRSGETKDGEAGGGRERRLATVVKECGKADVVVGWEADMR